MVNSTQNASYLQTAQGAQIPLSAESPPRPAASGRTFLEAIKAAHARTWPETTPKTTKIEELSTTPQISGENPTPMKATLTFAERLRMSNRGSTPNLTSSGSFSSPPKESTAKKLASDAMPETTPKKYPRMEDPLVTRKMLDELESRLMRPAPQEFKCTGYIAPYIKTCQYVVVQQVAHQILFSQETVAASTKDGELSLDQLAERMLRFFPREYAIDIVAVAEETYTSVDNRRLLVAKRIAQNAPDRLYGIWVRVHLADELLAGQGSRFGEAKTWGEAVLMRINNIQRREQLQYTRGSFGFSAEPKIRTPFHLPPKLTLSLSLVNVDLASLHPDDQQQIKKRENKGIILI